MNEGTSGWSEDDPDFSTIETIADGVVTASGAFVRTFWDWSEATPWNVVLRARVASRTHTVDVALEDLQQWISEEQDGQTLVFINGHHILLPTNYISLLPAQIEWLNGDHSLPIPGTLPGEDADVTRYE